MFVRPLHLFTRNQKENCFFFHSRSRTITIVIAIVIFGFANSADIVLTCKTSEALCFIFSNLISVHMEYTNTCWSRSHFYSTVWVTLKRHHSKNKISINDSQQYTIVQYTHTCLLQINLLRFKREMYRLDSKRL